MVYRLFFRYVSRYRYLRFPFYDSVRSLVRPGTPSISITLSLSLVGILLVFFLLFSLSFRDRVSSGAGDISVFAINILPQNVPAIRTYDPDISLYSVLRARIVRIGTRTLAQHFGGAPSGEYTREFNITRDDRSAETVSGQSSVGTGEVSVDRDFAKRL
jgi:predicted lysophospholipase L1 biosynthesis ABC-type transport system permease subunit